MSSREERGCAGLVCRDQKCVMCQLEIAADQMLTEPFSRPRETSDGRTLARGCHRRGSIKGAE